MEASVITALAGLADKYGEGVIISLFLGYCFFRWVPVAAKCIGQLFADFVGAQVKIAASLAELERIAERQVTINSAMSQMQEDIREIRRGLS